VVSGVEAVTHIGKHEINKRTAYGRSISDWLTDGENNETTEKLTERYSNPPTKLVFWDVMVHSFVNRYPCLLLPIFRVQNV